MTTIVYFDGVIAYDSRLTKGDVVISDTVNKHRRRRGAHFFFAGNFDEFDSLIDSYFANKKVGQLFDGEAIVYDKGKLYTCGIIPGEGWYLSEESLKGYVTLGSGEHIAIGALEMGASAAESVRIAKKKDTKTNGRIRTFHLPK